MLSLSFAAECKRCTNSVQKFLKSGIKASNNKWSPDQYIPNDILMKAKGLAILTVFKAGFMWGGCAGTGLVLARLANGGWSAPSAIALGGISFGAQIGGEVIYLVILLNTDSAVKAFSHGGNFTLGGQLSVSAGPYGRTGEVKGAARDFAPLYSYSKSKGLFAGISIEGSIVTERTNTNRNFYKRTVRAKELLRGKVPVPSEAESLIRALSPGANTQQESSVSVPNVVTPPPAALPGMHLTNVGPSAPTQIDNQPLTTPAATNLPIVHALYDFMGERPGDLSFKKGDAIIIVQQRRDQNEWWIGRCNGREGPFPANYCDISFLTHFSSKEAAVKKAA